MVPLPADPRAIAQFVRREQLAVLATSSAEGRPEAALVGVAALDDGTLVVDAPAQARKVANLHSSPRVAVVVGFGDVSIQLEGVATLAIGAERERLGGEYEAQLPGSRALDPDFCLIVIRPDWARVYDAQADPPSVQEARWPGVVY